MRFRHLLVLTLGIIAISTGAPLVRLAEEAPALSKAAWRLLFAVALFAPLALSRARWRSELVVLLREERRATLAGGFALALHFGLWIPSLDYTSVASSVVLVTLSPLFVSLLAPRLLGERVGGMLRAGVMLAVAGAVVIGWGDASLGARALFGDALALGGAFGAALYFLVGRRLRGRVGVVPYACAIYGVAAVVLTALVAATGQPLAGFAPRTWVWLILLALLPQVVGHTSFNWALAGLSATFVTVATLGEPIGSTLLAWWWLAEAPPVRTVLGGMLVLAGLALAARAESSAMSRRGSDGGATVAPLGDASHRAVDGEGDVAGADADPGPAKRAGIS